jgi:hypothetical protein
MDVMLLTDAELDDIYERSKVDAFIAGSEVRQLVGEIRQHRQDVDRLKRLDRVDTALAKQLGTSIERNAKMQERLSEIRREVEQWLRCYATDIFPEPDLKKAATVLKDNGMTIDSLSAEMGRHVLKHMLKVIDRPAE